MSIDVRIYEDKSSETDEIVLVFELLSNQNRSISTYMTPFEGFAGDILKIRDSSDKPIRYLGRSVKRGPQPLEDYMALFAGEAASVTFSLGKHYELPQSGVVTVQFKGRPMMNELPDSNVLQIKLR